MSEKTRKIMRPGKTKKDAARGVQKRNDENKQKRASWLNDGKRDNKNFPSETCNGKANRY
jgi:hypothetical protein